MATDSDKEENDNQNDPKALYDGENMNASSDDVGNTDEDAPEMPYDGEKLMLFIIISEIMMRLPPTHLQMT